MRKYKALILVFIISSFAYSQSESNIKKYKADGIYLVLQNESGQQLTKIPFGKNVKIEYDTFFKKYEITYQNRDGESDNVELYFLSKNEIEGTIFNQMKDNFGNIYNVTGNIDKIGTLLIIFDKKTEDGNITLLAIEGAKRE